MTRRFSFVVLSWLVSACGADGPGTKPVVHVPWGQSGASAGDGKARWAYTPSGPRGLLGRQAVGDGTTLYFGRRGERWLVDEGKGRATAAGDLAEQDLVASSRSASGGWLFVGEGGAIYESDEVLGAFRRTTTAPEPVAKLEAGAQGLLAVTLRGQLLRSTDGGVTFARSPVGSGPLADEPFVGDVQLVEGGKGLLLAYPEKLYETADGGVHWRPLEARSVGAGRLSRQGEDGVLVQGAIRSLSWHAGSPPRPSQARPDEGAFTLPVALDEAPDASLFSSGLAFWRGGQVVEAIPPAKRNGAWQIGTGAVGERLTVAPLEGTEGCMRLALDGHEQGMVVACAVPQRGATLAAVKVLRYGPSGGTPEVLEGTLEGSLGEARVALGPDGRVLVWGACRAGSTRTACEGETALLLPRWPSELATAGAGGGGAAGASGSSGHAGKSDKGSQAAGGETGGGGASGASGAASPWLSVASASQSGRPMAARFSADGSVAYVVAQQGKTRDLGLFVSRDGGRRFEARDLGLSGALDESDRRRLTGLRGAVLSTLDDGLVTIGFEGQGGALVVVTDEDGRVLSASPTPVSSSTTHLGLAGRRVLVVDGARGFESLDGGVSWTPLGEPPALKCPDRGGCERRVGCSAAGCFVGDTLARVGWGGQREARTNADVVAAPAMARSATLPALTCRLGRDKWLPLARGAELPAIERADRGKTPWAAAAVAPVSGQVSVIHGLPSGKTEEVTLVPGVSGRALDTVSQYVSTTQVEGTAVLRVELTPRQDGAPLVRRAEVFWENLFDGKRGRATLPVPSDLRLVPDGTPGSMSAISTSMLSISQGGVFVQLGSDSSDLIFADYRGHTDRTPAPVLPTQGADGESLSLRAEAVRVDNRTVPIAYGDSLFARLKGRDDPEVMALFPPASSPFQPSNHLTFSYLNGAPLLVHVGVVPRSGATRVTLLPFLASGPVLGPPQPGPSQRAYADQPRTCTAADRARTGRFIAPIEPGTRRGILVEGPDGSPFAALASGGLVMYGTSVTACGTVVEGVSISEDAPDRERALVYLDALDRSWFFRRGVADVVEARLMTCRPAAAGTVLPPELQAVIDAAPAAGPSIVIGGRRVPFRRPRRRP